MAAAEVLIKICALIFGGACYVLLIFFHSALYTTYDKLIICAIFSGFLVLYIAFAIGVFLNNDTDTDLNSAWALYGVAAYIGAGCLCIITFVHRSSPEAVMGLIAGAVSLVQAAVLVADVIVLQQD